MRVRAIAKGYMGRLYQEGDEFTVKPGTTGTWFVPVEAPKEPEAPKGKGKAAPAKATAKANDADDLV